ncbi:MAG: hypothetical protein ACXWAX_08715 [Chthoniobacterales bacterium]
MNLITSLVRTNRLAFASVTAGVLLFIGWNVRERISFALPTPEIKGTTEVAPQFLPFSFENVVRYFEDTLATSPQERLMNQVIFRGGTRDENFYTITITRRGPELLVAFNVIDDYGMNLVREFFEAPFFQSRESQEFYALLSSQNGTRSVSLPRFNLLFDYSSRGLDANVTMIFSPRMRSLSANAIDLAP